MLKEWQFNVLFFVGVGGALFLLIGPEVGLNVSQNPTAVTGIGAILTYILTQKKSITKGTTKKNKESESETPDDLDLSDKDRIYQGGLEEQKWEEDHRRRKKDDS